MNMINLIHNLLIIFIKFDRVFSMFENVSEVIFASVLYRHGDRTPVKPYPTDPYRNVSLWPVQWGQLTHIGKEQQFLLGQWLRQRYSNFLPSVYSELDIHIQSTDMDRTLMSAECNLAGLYLPVPQQRFNPEIRWQPIPVHTVPELEDYILAAKKPCPRYSEEYERVENSPEMQIINKKNAPLYSYLTENAGMVIQTVTDVEYFYNTLFIEELYNFTLPNWTKSVYPEKLKPLADFSFLLPTKTKILKKLKTGPLLGEITSNMMKKRNGALTPDRKMFVYSCHDTTIANVLNTLGVFDAHSPPYTATVLIELRLDATGKYYVVVEYHNTTGDPSVLQVPGCAELCPLDMFVKLTEEFVPKDWEKECHSLETSKDCTYATYDVLSIAIIASAMLGTCLLLLLVGSLVYWCLHQSEKTRYHRLHQDA
ncbi:lysosomal acid phosphatase-like [Bacillus rossius redtenbacheri]|uniref:lysosomal acid phosphatase-like n=1 Tax=Bacillus rossius redtenbacheri TaxID=93214 RepID=UPI002FDD4C3B